MNFFGKEMRELADEIQNVDVGYKKTTTRTVYVQNAEYEFDEEIWGCIISVDGEKLWNDYPAPITVVAKRDEQQMYVDFVADGDEDDERYWAFYEGGEQLALVGVSRTATKLAIDPVYSIYASFGNIQMTVSVYGQAQENVEISPDFENAVVGITGIGNRHEDAIVETTIELQRDNEYFFGGQEYASKEEYDWFYKKVDAKFQNDIPFPPFTLEIDGNAFEMTEANVGDEMNPHWVWLYSTQDAVMIQGVCFNGISIQFEPSALGYSILIGPCIIGRETALPTEITPTIKAYIDNIVVDDNVADAIANKIGGGSGGGSGVHILTFTPANDPQKIDGMQQDNCTPSMSFSEVMEAINKHEIVLASCFGELAVVSSGSSKKVASGLPIEFPRTIIEDYEGTKIRYFYVTMDSYNGDDVCNVRYSDSFPINFNEIIT